MVTRIWRGDAPETAQVTRVTPANVEIGDVFTLTCNGKSISVTATAATAANVVNLFVAALNATDIPEFTEFTATNSSNTLLLTANEPGVPFTVTASASNGSSLGVTISTVQEGVSASAASNHVQSFAIPKSAAGTFEITLGDQLATGISVGASAATVRTFVEGLSTVGAGNVAVTKADSADGNDDVYTLTFQGALAATTVAEVIVDLISTKPLIRTSQQGSTTGTVRNERQTIGLVGAVSGNTFTLTLDGQTTTAIANPSGTGDISATIANALEALSNVLDVTVTKGSDQTYTVEFIDYDGSANQLQLTASVYSSSGTATSRIAITNTPPTSAVLAANEKQLILLSGSPTGGTFTLTFGGQTTSAIAYNASASTVQTALRALSSIGSGNVNVSLDSGGWLVEFVGTLAGANQAAITGNGASLTGGSAQSITVASVTSSAGPNHWDTAANWLPAGVPTTGDDVVFQIGNVDCLYGLDQTGVTLASLSVQMGYTGSIGLKRVNSANYLEYRPRELTCGITSIVIGQGEGSGPRKVALNTLTTQTAIRVIDSGSSSENGVPPVIWRGAHADNTIKVQGGDFGAAWWSNESAQISFIEQTGGTVFLKNTTIDDYFDATGQTFRAANCTLGGKPFNL